MDRIRRVYKRDKYLIMSWVPIGKILLVLMEVKDADREI